MKWAEEAESERLGKDHFSFLSFLSFSRTLSAAASLRTVWVPTYGLFLGFGGAPPWLVGWLDFAHRVSQRERQVHVLGLGLGHGRSQRRCQRRCQRDHGMNENLSAILRLLR